MPIPRRHLPVCVPILVGLAAIGIVVGLRSADIMGLSDGFVGDALIALAGMIAVALVLDIVLISHSDKHRY